MWLDETKLVQAELRNYRRALLNSTPSHVVIDGLFNEAKLDEVMQILRQPGCWEAQRHTYSALYVDEVPWLAANDDQRFVRRHVWRRPAADARDSASGCFGAGGTGLDDSIASAAHEFLSFLRSGTFLSALSKIFKVSLTDMNVSNPAINTNYFRLSPDDFVRQHADDSPGREVCMLLYLNKPWSSDAGGELVFAGPGDEPIRILPRYNRCVLFNPSSKGSEHWVEALNLMSTDEYRYNVTSWYWSE